MNVGESWILRRRRGFGGEHCHAAELRTIYCIQRKVQTDANSDAVLMLVVQLVVIKRSVCNTAPRRVRVDVSSGFVAVEENDVSLVNRRTGNGHGRMKQPFGFP